MKRVFLDIDTQLDFMMPDGALYVKNAENLIPNILKLSSYAKEKLIPVIATLDTHTPDDPEFKIFPPHCVEGSLGHKKIEGTYPEEAKIIEISEQHIENSFNWIVKKPSYSAFSNVNFETFLSQRFKKYEFVVYGVATDYCVKHTSLGLLERGYRVLIVEDAITGVAPDTTEEAIRELKSKGAVFVKTAEVTE